MDYKEVVGKLNSLKNPKNIAGMARFGIRPKTKVLGISIPELRKLSKEIKKVVGSPTSHQLALKLWDSKIHEARILAGYIADATLFTEKDMEKWVLGFDSWDVVDQVCSSLFDKTKFVYKKIFELAKCDESAFAKGSGETGEFVKRTAFTLMACLAVHDKKMPDEKFLKFFPVIEKASTDERNFVKKAVNWALRQIGKRNKSLNKQAIKLAKKIQKIDSKSARWIANDAIRELTRVFSNKFKYAIV